MSTLFLVTSFFDLLTWLIILVVGAAGGINELTIVGAILLAISILIILGIFFTQRNQRIVLSGTFSTEWFLLPKDDARALETQIIENSYYAQQSFSHQSPLRKVDPGISFAPAPPPPLFYGPPAKLPPTAHVAQDVRTTFRGPHRGINDVRDDF